MDKEQIIKLIEEQCQGDFTFGKVCAYRYVDQNRITLLEWVDKIAREDNRPGLNTVINGLFDKYSWELDKVFNDV